MIDELTDTLTNEQAFNALINKLIDAMIRQEDCNRKAIYWQGWKNCVKLCRK